MTATESSAVPQAEPASSTASKKRRRGCGCWTILLTAFLVLVVIPASLLVATFVWLRVSDSYALDRELDLAREAGYPLTLEELNASYPTSPDIEEATAHWQRVIEIVQGEDYRKAATDVPFVDRSAETEKVEFVLPLKGDSLDAARAFVTRFAPAIEAAHSARRAGAVARFPVRFEKRVIEDASRALGLRDAVDLLRLDLEVRIAGEDFAAAVEDALSMAAASDSLTNEPQTASQLARHIFLGTASEAAIVLATKAELSDDQLRRLQEAFASRYPMQEFRLAIRWDRYALLNLPRFGSSIDDPRDETEGVSLFPDGDLAAILAFFRELEAASGQDPAAAYEAICRVFDDSQLIGSGSFSTSRSLDDSLNLPLLRTCADASARSDAERGLTTTAIAIERFRSANGSPPGALEELVPDYLKAVPIDPFDGQALRYKTVNSVMNERADRSAPDGVLDAPRGPSVLLYSVSRNGQDDGGLHDFFGGDIALFLPGRGEAGDGN